MDTGIQRLYLSSKIHMFNCNTDRLNKKELVIKTFIGAIKWDLKEIELNLKLTDKKFSLPFLVEENLEIDFHLDGLGVVINNLKRNGYKLAADFSDMRNDTLSLHGL